MGNEIEALIVCDGYCWISTILVVIVGAATIYFINKERIKK